MRIGLFFTDGFNKKTEIKAYASQGRGLVEQYSVLTRDDRYFSKPSLLSYPQDLFDRGLAGQHLLNSALAKGFHFVLYGKMLDLR